MKIPWLSAWNTVTTGQTRRNNALMLSTDSLIVELTTNKLRVLQWFWRNNSPMALKTTADLHKIIHSWVNATPGVGGLWGGDPPCPETQWRATDCVLTVTPMVKEGERRDTKVGWPAMARMATFPRRRQLGLSIKPKGLAPRLFSSEGFSDGPTSSVGGQSTAAGNARLVALLPRATLASRAVRAGGAHGRLDRS